MKADQPQLRKYYSSAGTAMAMHAYTQHRAMPTSIVSIRYTCIYVQYKPGLEPPYFMWYGDGELLSIIASLSPSCLQPGGGGCGRGICPLPCEAWKLKDISCSKYSKIN